MSDPSTPTEPQARKNPVAIDRVVSLAETRDVRPLNREHVELLALAVDQLPPIDVVKLVGGQFGLLAGYHRLAAHELAGKKTVRLVVHDLAVEDWHPFVVRSNLQHGLPLTLAQRKAAARHMLADNPGRSSRAVAKDCGLSDKTVEALRRPEADDETTAEPPQLRVGRDGKARRMPPRRSVHAIDDFDDAIDQAVAEFRRDEDAPESTIAIAPMIEDGPSPFALTTLDLGGGISHPARFPDAIIEQFGFILLRHKTGPRILDPFAGTGRVHELRSVLAVASYETFGVELEPEWAALHPDTREGDALNLPFPDNDMDALVSSPCYGNRFADRDMRPSVAGTYAKGLGRLASEGSACHLQWGPEYRDFHERAWKEAARVLRPGGLFVLNIKDHTRDGQRQHVAGWHVTALCRLGFTLLEHVEVPTPNLRVGDNAEARWPEQIYVLRLDTTEES